MDGEGKAKVLVRGCSIIKILMHIYMLIAVSFRKQSDAWMDVNLDDATPANTHHHGTYLALTLEQTRVMIQTILGVQTSIDTSYN